MDNATLIQDCPASRRLRGVLRWWPRVPAPPLVWTIILGLGLRLFGVTSPLIGEQSWRQTDTASIARNYYEGGYDFLHPQVDWRGKTSGYAETEFPLYQFMVALAYGVFGFGEFWGRLLSVGFSLTSIFFLFLFVRDLADELTASWAAFFVAILPLSAFFGRVFMPEPLLMMSSVAGLYFFSGWARTGSIRRLFASGLFIAIAALVKLPALYLGGPLLFLAINSYGLRVLRSLALWLYALGVLTAVALWYYHAHQLFLETGCTFGIWMFGTDKWGNWELVTHYSYWRHILFNRLVGSHLTWAGGVLLMIGLMLKRRNRAEWVFDVWLGSLIVYLFIVGVGNQRHVYYQLPLVYPCAVFMGKVLGKCLSLPDHWRLKATVTYGILVIAVLVLGIPEFASLHARERPERNVEMHLAAALRESSSPADGVGTVTHGDPTTLYLSDRKGWVLQLDDIRRERLQAMQADGLQVLGGYYRKGGEEREAASALGAISADVEMVTVRSLGDHIYFVARLKDE